MKNEDVISWKFQEKFFEMGIRFILPIGDLQVYNNIHKYIIKIKKYVILCLLYKKLI